MNILVIPINGPTGSIYYEAISMDDAKANCPAGYQIVCWGDQMLDTYTSAIYL